MSNFPTSFDDDSSLPAINDNITEIGGTAINALRDAVFNIENNLGLGLAGTMPSLATRLGVAILPNGNLNPSALTSLGLVTLPITQDQIANNAGIPESKLSLNYGTSTLYNYITNLSINVNTALGWIAITGIQLEPHLLGAIYRHSMDQIDVSHNTAAFPYLDNKFRLQRNNLQSYNLVNDINNELLAHQWADGSPFGVISNVTTNNGSTYPSNYAHVSSGIFLDTSRFQTIPQNDQDVQSAFEYIDSSSILLLGTRIQNLYSNGISVNSRSSSLTADGYGQSVVPPTAAIAYLLAPNGNNSAPVDNIANGDDIIQLMPTQPDGYVFDAQFALVEPGDKITINYGGVEVAFVIKEKKYIAGVNGNNSSFYVRIAGKNLQYSAIASAQIDKPLFNNNKYGVLGVATANSLLTGAPSSLIVGSPRAAQTLGIGFNASQFGPSNYLLYLALYPNGNPNDGYTILPAIDVTGNLGMTPGSYTLDSIVLATNNAFRQPGFNYRFIAFEYQGEFGIMLADSYNNVAFSVVSYVVSPTGAPDLTQTGVVFPNNVVSPPPSNLPDPLGFGPLGSNIASPPFMTSYGSAAAASLPTQLLVPLARNNFYVNGVEEQRLNLEIGQALDTYGDGYWNATISNVVSGSGHVAVTYNINLDLSTSDLKIGKTLVVQSAGSGGLVNFGRFIITNVNFVNCPITLTQITVYDAVHAIGISPSPILAVGSPVCLYFNSDSVAFNDENSSDFSSYVPTTANFKRFFEVYVDQNAATYTNERARLNINGSTITVNGVPLYGSSALSFINIDVVSPKLQGFNYGTITKTNLQIQSYNQATGLYDGYLCNYNGSSITNAGPLTQGQKGQITRFYDQTNVDYIDLIFTSTDNVPTISLPTNIDIQLFPTLELDQEIMLLGTCQFNDTNSQVNYSQDERQFGNISEEQLTTSAIDFIQAPTRELQENGVIRGFDIVGQANNTISFTGGTAVINGSIVNINTQTIDIPALLESLPTTIGGSPGTISTVNIITWFVCVNSNSELVLVASTDFDPAGQFASQYQAAGLNHQRLFYVINPNAMTPVPYPITGTYFANLILTQTDVVPIAVAIGVTTNNGGYTVSELIVQDARRFVANGYGGLAEPLTLGANASFQSIEAIFNWLTQFNDFVSATSSQANAISNKVIVKGHNPINIVTPLNFVNADVYFEGDGTSNFDIYCPTGFIVGSNVHFDKINFNYYYDPTTMMDLNTATLLSGTFTVSASTNVITNSSQVGILSAGSVISFVSQLGVIYVVSAVSSGNITLTTSYTGSSATTTAYFGLYNTNNFVNDGFGALWIDDTSAINNISITNCHFSWYPTISNTAPLFTSATSSGINRYSFINVDLAQPSISAATILQNVNIIGNTFADNTLLSFSAAATETVRAAISFISTSTTTTPNTVGVGMKMIDVIVRDNICDKDQMIVIAPTYSTTPGTIANTIDTTNVLIENNTCGVISAFTQYNLPFDINQTWSFNFLNYSLDKNNGLVIRNNTCKYITSTDSTGKDLVGISQVLSQATGPMIISDNTTSWIRLPLNGAAALTIIKNNVLNAYDTNFQKQFTSGIRNAAIEITIASSVQPSAPNTILIDGNQINQGFYSTITPSVSSYFYDFGIYSFCHDLNACNNLIQYLGKTIQSTNPVGIYLDTAGVSLHSNIHHNKFIRGETPWLYYVFAGTGGSTNIVSYNYFDQLSPDGILINGVSEKQITNNGSVLTALANVNQGVNLPVGLLDGSVYYSSVGAAAVSGTGPATGSDFERIDIVTSLITPGNVEIFKYSQTPSIGIGAQYTGILEFVDSQISNYRNASFIIPLSTYLPVGVKILQVQVGMWLQYYGAASLVTSSAADNAVSLTIAQSTDSLSTLNSSLITDVARNIFPETPNVQTGLDFSAEIVETGQVYTILLANASSSGSGYSIITPTKAQAATNFLTLSSSNYGADTFITTNTNRIFAQLDINFLRTGGSVPTDQVAFFFSPMLITYSW